MKSFALLLLFSWGLNFSVNSQNTGIVNYSHLGIQFTIPVGWSGREVPGGYLLGSNTDPGFAFLSIMEARSLKEMRSMAQEGFSEDGIHLQSQGHLEQLGPDRLGGLFSGVLQGKQVTAYLIGVLNPYGSSVFILAAATPDRYSTTHEYLATQLAGSLFFSPPDPSAK